MHLLHLLTRLCAPQLLIRVSFCTLNFVCNWNPCLIWLSNVKEAEEIKRQYNYSKRRKVSETLCKTSKRLIVHKALWWVGGTTGSASDQQSTNDRKVASSRPTKVVCITVLTGNRMGWTARCDRPPLLLPRCRKLEFRLSANWWTRIWHG